MYQKSYGPQWPVTGTVLQLHLLEKLSRKESTEKILTKFEDVTI
jgi:hypothetical protein